MNWTAKAANYQPQRLRSAVRRFSGRFANLFFLAKNDVKHLIIQQVGVLCQLKVVFGHQNRFSGVKTRFQRHFCHLKDGCKVD